MWGLGEKMKFEEFITSPSLNLPKKRGKSDSFNNYLNELLLTHVEKAKEVEFPEDIDRMSTMERLEDLTNAIIKAVDFYYHGKPFDAYDSLKKGITLTEIHKFWENHSFEPKQNFYRIRKKDSNYPLSREELFHIPFNLRGKIKTQRFSIPGFPTLYLSNSIYTAWEEMRRPNLEAIQAARLENKSSLKLIDLTNSKYSGNYDMEKKTKQMKIYDFLMWPLVAACSIKVNETDDYFKPEYIIPQLLLQWIRNNVSVHGIKFSSTHIDLNETKSEGNFYNLALPVIDNKESGYCSQLSNMFQLTEVLSWQLHDLSTGGATFSFYDSELRDINPDIKKIEMIEGRPFPYGYSPISMLELALKSMKAKDIDFV
jgi:hypothetical protein